MTDDRPLIEEFKEEQMAGPGWMGTGLSPREYVARHAHEIGTFGRADYRYRDPEVQRWVEEFAQALKDVDACRDEFLTPEEKRHFEEEALEL